MLTARATGAQRLVYWCPTLGLLMPNAWSVDAQRLVPECPFDGQDRPLDGLWQNGLCNFIPKEVFELVILHIDNLATGHLLWPVPVFYNACFEAQIFFWWRVMKGEIAPITLWNPDKHRGFREKDEGWRVFCIFDFRKLKTAQTREVLLFTSL